MTDEALRRSDELLSELIEIVETARALPMSASCVLPRERVLDLLDELREVLPPEMDEARTVIATRDRRAARTPTRARPRRARARGRRGRHRPRRRRAPRRAARRTRPSERAHDAVDAGKAEHAPARRRDHRAPGRRRRRPPRCARTPSATRPQVSAEAAAVRRARSAPRPTATPTTRAPRPSATPPSSPPTPRTTPSAPSTSCPRVLHRSAATAEQGRAALAPAPGRRLDRPRRPTGADPGRRPARALSADRFRR